MFALGSRQPVEDPEDQNVGGGRWGLLYELASRSSLNIFGLRLFEYRMIDNERAKLVYVNSGKNVRWSRLLNKYDRAYDCLQNVTSLTKHYFFSFLSSLNPDILFSIHHIELLKDVLCTWLLKKEGLKKNERKTIKWSTYIFLRCNHCCVFCYVNPLTV